MSKLSTRKTPEVGFAIDTKSAAGDSPRPLSSQRSRCSSARSNRGADSNSPLRPSLGQLNGLPCRRKKKKQEEQPIRLLINGGKPRLPDQTVEVLDKDGKVDHNKVYFDPRTFIYEPKVFNEVPMDFMRCEIDPRDNPIYIQHAFLNGGKYPPEYLADQERFAEDVSNRVKPVDQVWKTLVHMTNMIDEDRNMILRKKHKYKMRQSLEELRCSGKPFYWIDHEKLRQLKQLCEQQKDPKLRKEAFEVLQEFKEVVEKYNQIAKKKITDIFPSQNSFQHQNTTTAEPLKTRMTQHMRKETMRKDIEQMVNITFIDQRDAHMQSKDQQEDTARSNPYNQGQSTSTPKKQHCLPMNVQSFLRQKILIKDQETLTRVKMLMNIRRPRKPKTSIYNQEVLRQQSRGKSRNGLDSDKEYPDTFLGPEFEPEFKRTYNQQVQQLSLTQGACKDGFLQLKSTSTDQHQERLRTTSTSTAQHARGGSFFGQRLSKNSRVNDSTSPRQQKMQHHNQPGLNSTLGPPTTSYFNQDLVVENLQKSFRKNDIFDQNGKVMTPQVGATRRMQTPMQQRQIFIGSERSTAMKDSRISQLSKSNRVRTVEGRARNPHTHHQRQRRNNIGDNGGVGGAPQMMKNAKTMLMDMARFEQVRNQAGSRLQEGKKGSNMAVDDTKGENLMFVSQQQNNTVDGLDQNLISGLGSEGPGSSIEIDEGELKGKDTFDASAGMSFEKSTAAKKPIGGINDTQHSGGDSTYKDSQFYTTSRYQDHPTSAIDGIFNSDIDQQTPENKKDWMQNHSEVRQKQINESHTPIRQQQNQLITPKPSASNKSEKTAVDFNVMSPLTQKANHEMLLMKKNLGVDTGLVEKEMIVYEHFPSQPSEKKETPASPSKQNEVHSQASTGRTSPQTQHHQKQYTTEQRKRFSEFQQKHNMRELKVGKALEQLREKATKQKSKSGASVASPSPKQRQETVKKLEQTSFIHSFVGHDNANDRYPASMLSTTRRQQSPPSQQQQNFVNSFCYSSSQMSQPPQNHNQVPIAYPPTGAFTAIGGFGRPGTTDASGANARRIRIKAGRRNGGEISSTCAASPLQQRTTTAATTTNGFLATSQGRSQTPMVGGSRRDQRDHHQVVILPNRLNCKKTNDTFAKICGNLKSQSPSFYFQPTGSGTVVSQRPQNSPRKKRPEIITPANTDEVLAVSSGSLVVQHASYQQQPPAAAQSSQ